MDTKEDSREDKTIGTNIASVFDHSLGECTIALMYTGTKRDQTKEGVNCPTMTKPDDNDEQFWLISIDAQS